MIADAVAADVEAAGVAVLAVVVGLAGRAGGAALVFSHARPARAGVLAVVDTVAIGVVAAWGDLAALRADVKLRRA